MRASTKQQRRAKLSQPGQLGALGLPSLLLMAACGPVLLFADPEAAAGGPAPSHTSAANHADAAAAGAPSTTPDQHASPRVVVNVRLLECGHCFELFATGVDGRPPYVYSWNDGSQGQMRKVCPELNGAEISVVAEDANARRSTPYMATLEGDEDSSCPSSAAVGSSAKLCITNASFEGTAGPNLGNNFDAPPWNACTSAAMTTNTPDVVDENLLQTFSVPPPQNGMTYLALSEGEQVSQMLCENVAGGSVRYLELDLATIDVTAGIMPNTGPIYLEIYAGVAAECTQSQLLWTSDALPFGWKRYCAKLAPSELMDQITLRARADTNDMMPAYLIADNLVPVDNCP